MKYLPDTNAIIGLVNRHVILAPRVHRQGPTAFGLSVIVTHELYFGAYKGRQIQDNLDRIAALRFQIVSFDNEDARMAGEIRATLAARGTPIGPYDTLVAGQALARGLTLITHNTREFKRVPGLKVEDWEV